MHCFRPFSGPRATETLCVSLYGGFRSGFPVGEVGTVARNRSPDKLSFLGIVKTDADFFST